MSLLLIHSLTSAVSMAMAEGLAGNECTLIYSTFTPQLVPSQPITTDDLERDAVFSQRVRLFGWIREKHLDVPEGEASQGFLGFAQQGQSSLLPD